MLSWPQILRTISILLLTVFLYDNSWARVAKMKEICSNCHTMHSSVGGAGDTHDIASGVADGVPGAVIAPQEGLINKTCSGCHNGKNSTGSMPYVIDLLTSGPPKYGVTGTEGIATRDTLAGGSFYWVTIADGGIKGHDVVGLNITQTNRTPPGGSKAFNDTTTPLTCAGTNGCHGDNAAGMSQVESIWGGHHANITGSVTGGTSAATSYRFLNGIDGFEDSTWELTVDSSNHNQYKGITRTGDDDLVANESSISHLCARCHGDFHNGDGTDAGVIGAAGSFGSPWVRHPVDVDMGPLAGAGTEYGSYGDGGAGIYNVRTPLASEDVSGRLSSVTLGGSGNNAIITCVTCHRAHGSEWDYSLRWKYYAWPDGSDTDAYNGCGDCHTAKN